jgi:hypothetical protein
MGATAGTGGSATPSAFAITSGSAIARANSIGTATSGTSSADAKANGTGIILQAHGIGTSTVDASGLSESRAMIAKAPPTFANASGQHAAAYAVGQPLSADVTTAWTGNANVQSAFGGVQSRVNGLGIANMVYPTGGSGASHTYSSVLDFTETGTLLSGSNELTAGLVASPLTGAGLGAGDSLRFRIQRAGLTLVDQTFTTNATVASYFQNTVFALGIENAWRRRWAA